MVPVLCIREGDLLKYRTGLQVTFYIFHSGLLVAQVTAYIFTSVLELPTVMGCSRLTNW